MTLMLMPGWEMQACHWAIDELKATVPIWKKEFFEGGEVSVGGRQGVLAGSGAAHCGGEKRARSARQEGQGRMRQKRTYSSSSSSPGGASSAWGIVLAARCAKAQLGCVQWAAGSACWCGACQQFPPTLVAPQPPLGIPAARNGSRIHSGSQAIPFYDGQAFATCVPCFRDDPLTSYSCCRCGRRMRSGGQNSCGYERQQQAAQGQEQEQEQLWGAHQQQRQQQEEQQQHRQHRQRHQAEQQIRCPSSSTLAQANTCTEGGGQAWRGGGCTAMQHVDSPTAFPCLGMVWFGARCCIEHMATAQNMRMLTVEGRMRSSSELVARHSGALRGV